MAQTSIDDRDTQADHPTTVDDLKAEKKVRQVTWAGLGLNLLLSAIKLAGGWWGHSQALVADGIHSLSDSTTDVAILVGSHFWLKPPDQRHPYGHRRIETLVTLFIGGVLLLAAGGIGWEGLSSLRTTSTQAPELLVVPVAVIAIVVKEWLYRWTQRVGETLQSPALVANAWHHRLDAFSSIPVLIAVGIALVWPQWAFLDRVAAIMVALMVMRAAFQILWEGLREILDEGASKEFRRRIITLAMGHEAVLEVHMLRTRYVGQQLYVDMHTVVEGSLTVKEGHDVAGMVKQEILKQIPRVKDVLIHVEPPEAMLHSKTGESSE